MVGLKRLTMDEPLFAFAGGGTGGHLFPALSVAEELRRGIPAARFVFFSTRRRIEDRIFQHVEAEVVRQTLSPLSKWPWRWPGILTSYHRAKRICRDSLDQHRPAVVIGTGGLASAPAVVEAVRGGIPAAILNPDATPGRANRYLARYADVVFAQWGETVGHFSRTVAVEVTGCPVRPGFLCGERVTGAAHFGLEPGRKTLLVTGASQGARTINEAVAANLDVLEELPEWQVLHLTGESDFAMVRQAYARRNVRAAVLPFTEKMPDALRLADLVVSRSGASTLAEITAVGRASILLPYPFHRDQHQLANAQCLVQAGAAELVRDSGDVNTNAPALRRILETFMRDGGKREAAAVAARRLGRPAAASVIAARLMKLCGERGTLVADETLQGIR